MLFFTNLEFEYFPSDYSPLSRFDPLNIIIQENIGTEVIIDKQKLF